VLLILESKTINKHSSTLMTSSRLIGVKESLEVSLYQPPLYIAQTAFTNEDHDIQRCWHNNHIYVVEEVTFDSRRHVRGHTNISITHIVP
jgi:hypothetical protein